MARRGRDGVTRRLADAVWRLALRLGFQVARQWWRLTCPAHLGAVVVVHCGDEVLLLRQSYRRGLCLPGGGVHPGEDPREAAKRELREELGLDVPTQQLVPVGTVAGLFDYRRDLMHVFELALATRPALALDNREIVGARFFAVSELAAADLVQGMREAIACAGQVERRP